MKIGKRQRESIREREKRSREKIKKVMKCHKLKETVTNQRTQALSDIQVD